MTESVTRRTADEELPLAVSANWTAPQMAGWMAALYVALTVLGVFALRLPGATIRGNEFSIELCIFNAVNAATLTGFPQSVPIDHYGPVGQAVVLMLMSAGTLLSLIIGGLALNVILRMPFSHAKVVGGTVYIYVMALGIGTTLLLEPSRGLLAAAAQAASAFGNSGLYLGRLPGIEDWRTHAVLMPLAFLGGLGVPVILELSEALFGKRKPTVHASVVLRLLAGVYVIGLIVLLPWHLNLGFGSALANASAESLNSRTCGLPLSTLGGVSRSVHWLLMALMLIGAAPAGVAGGMKVTSLYHAWNGVKRAWRGESGHPIAAVAIAWIAGYAAVVFVVLIALLATFPQMAADRLAFLAVSAVGNVGLTHEPIGVSGVGMYVLSAAMLIGRAAPLILIWWVARNVKDVDVAI